MRSFDVAGTDPNQREVAYRGAPFMSAGGFLGVNTSAGSGALPAGGSVARLVEWHLLLSSQRDVAAAATSLQHSGFEVNRSGDDRLARDPWGTHVRLRRDC